MSEDSELITEVPAHIRTQSAPPPSSGRDLPPRNVSPEPATEAAPPAVQERTRVRASSSAPDGMTVATRAGALRQPTGVTVPAVWCPSGHFSPPDAAYCRVCGAAVPEQQPIRVPRPALGTLRVPEHDRVPLDRTVILGRRPLPLPGGEPWPHLIELPSELTHLSRNHVAVELAGWHVLARDLGSSGGTALHAPDRPPIRLRPHDPHVLEPGWSLVLGGDFAVTFEVGSG